MTKNWGSGLQQEPENPEAIFGFFYAGKGRLIVFVHRPSALAKAHLHFTEVIQLPNARQCAPQSDFTLHTYHTRCHLLTEIQHKYIQPIKGSSQASVRRGKLIFHACARAFPSVVADFAGFQIRATASPGGEEFQSGREPA
ncbi:MAG: hypothetical protein SWN98_10045 [Pseudomonadota bacterium]|nr:hypothetical protein [Pseudomonadota bacterium]